MADPQMKLPPGATLESAGGSQTRMKLPPGAELEGASQQPSVWGVLTQPTDKTDKEYLGYTGPAGVAGATIKGLDDVARNTRGALRGVWDTLTPALTDQEAQEGYTDTGRFGPVQVKRIAEPLISAAKQVPQIPSAVRDINQSPDPTGRYLEAAQDTASQGAGQALAALATTGVAKTAASVAPYVGPVAGALAKGYAKKLIPGEVGEAIRAVKGVQTPDPALAQSKPLSSALSPAAAPAAGIAGQIADSMRNPTPSTEVAPGLNRGALQDLLDKSLGAKKLDPKVPLRQQIPATSGTGVSTAPADAAASSSSAEPEHMGQFARANGLELHQAIPETVDGDVLRAKIHDMTNVQVRQLAINSGVDMGQMPVTNAKNTGGVTRQQALNWIMMNRTPEEIGDMIDRGQHLPGPPSGAISSALASSGQ